MASITKEINGRKTIQFVASDGKRRSVRLGEMADDQAVTVKEHVEHLVWCLAHDKPWCMSTSKWVAALDVDSTKHVLADRLAAVGLIPPRVRQVEDRATLGKFIDEYIASRTDIKPLTIRHLKDARRNLVTFFGENKLLVDITPGDADEFRLRLLQRLGDNTVRRQCGRAKQFFRAAVRKRLIQQSPFADMKGCVVRANKGREFFVTGEMSQRVLDACPDGQWRLMFALARFGGLRTPSETLALRRTDINWETLRFTVHSSKTEHHEGGGVRVVPIYPELLPYLEAEWDAAPEGAEFVITHYRDPACNLRTQLERIIAKAGLSPWPKLWQNLRASRATELASAYPGHVAAHWLGHSTVVAQKHYWQVTDLDYERASGAVQKAVQQGPATAGTVQKSDLAINAKPLAVQGVASHRDLVHKYSVPPVGLEPTT